MLLSECAYLKNVLCGLPSLTLPVPSDQFLLQTDASGVGLGAVLSVVRGEEEHSFQRNFSQEKGSTGPLSWKDLQLWQTLPTGMPTLSHIRLQSRLITGPQHG